MAGLVPAIHVFEKTHSRKDVDARDKRGHNDSVAVYPAKPASIRAQLRAPLRKDSRSYFSFGE
jgi:hypothetical protein